MTDIFQVEIWQLKSTIPGKSLVISYLMSINPYNVISLYFNKNEDYEVQKIEENQTKYQEKGYLIKSHSYNEKVVLSQETFHKYFYCKKTKHKVEFDKKMDKILG